MLNLVRFHVDHFLAEVDICQKMTLFFPGFDSVFVYCRPINNVTAVIFGHHLARGVRYIMQFILKRYSVWKLLKLIFPHLNILSISAKKKMNIFLFIDICHYTIDFFVNI